LAVAASPIARYDARKLRDAGNYRFSQSLLGCFAVVDRDIDHDCVHVASNRREAEFK
jgi:hypothetical protein